MNRRLALPLLAIAAGAVFSVPAGAALREIAVGNFYFEDETVGDGKIVAQVGDQLRFSMLDGGPGTPHTVEVDELGIHSGNLAAGETFTTPPIGQAGTFILYCKPHDQRGHKATLVVSGTSVTTPTTAPPATTAPTSATTAPTTVTTGPTTATTAKVTTTTKLPATTATTVSAGGAGSSQTTTTAKPTTTAPTPSSGGGSGGAVPATGEPNAVSTTSAGLTPVAAETDPASDTDVGEPALVPVGRGTVDDVAGPAGSFEELLNRRLRGRDGPWTRSIRLSLAALVPMALAAGAVLRRRPGGSPDPGER